MSASEIIRELPRLSDAERRAIRRRLAELAEENEAVRLCDATTLEAAQQLDKMEDEDERHAQG
ncbi:MAG: hypothetical protein AB1705_14445 [Verrucomicrobiota bacterium]